MSAIKRLRKFAYQLLSLGWRARRKHLQLWLQRQFMPKGRRDNLPSSPRNILFVCHGNIMRSPYAAAHLEHLLTKASLAHAFTIRSAGILAQRNRPADPRAISIASNKGFTLGKHLSQPISLELIREADLVLVMDRLNETLLLTRFPGAQSKVRLLGFFAVEDATESPEIDDPYASDNSTVAGCFQQIDRSIQGFGSIIIPAFNRELSSSHD